MAQEGDRGDNTQEIVPDGGNPTSQNEGEGANGDAQGQPLKISAPNFN